MSARTTQMVPVDVSEIRLSNPVDSGIGFEFKGPFNIHVVKRFSTIIADGWVAFLSVDFNFYFRWQIIICGANNIPTSIHYCVPKSNTVTSESLTCHK